MKVSDMFPSKYLRGCDLSGPVTVTIAGIRAERLYRPGKGEVEAWVLFCEKASKGVVLSKTLADQIAAALESEDTDNWPGKPVVLYPESITVAGRRVLAVRARAVKKEHKQEVTDEHKQDKKRGA